MKISCDLNYWSFSGEQFVLTQAWLGEPRAELR